MNNTKENPNITIARESSQKLDFYFIALVFTILGLSIQTSSIIPTYNQWLFEILAWVCFLISGLTGLSRLEWMPVSYHRAGVLEEKDKKLNIFNGQYPIILKSSDPSNKWSREEIEEEKVKLKKEITSLKKEVTKLNKRILFKFCIHKWVFVMGICCLIIARGLIGFNNYCVNKKESKAITTQSTRSESAPSASSSQ